MRRRAYPRVCGATANRCSALARFAGLSPRVRGNRNINASSISKDGPIPACAGQPTFHTLLNGATGAYPRVCGATAPCDVLLNWMEGLSPRVRGNLLGFGQGGHAEGPIPACAGQPRSKAPFSGVWWAYPRVCGATPAAHELDYPHPGLSPRVRGNRSSDIQVLCQVGPIPACAGQPRHHPPQSVSLRAYPRVCGATSCT